MITIRAALRVIMRRLREIMSEAGDGQARLDKIVRQIAGVMVTEVCSIYLKRAGRLAGAVRQRGSQPRRRALYAHEAR